MAIIIFMAAKICISILDSYVDVYAWKFISNSLSINRPSRAMLASHSMAYKVWQCVMSCIAILGDDAIAILGDDVIA